MLGEPSRVLAGSPVPVAEVPPMTRWQVRSGLFLIYFIALAMLVDGKPPGAVLAADIACSLALIGALAVYVWWVRRQARLR